MPSVEAHVAQAEHNEAIADELQRLGADDWQITTLFYAALHYADAVLAPYHPGGHRDRGRRVAAALPEVTAEYIQLRDRSEEARYGAVVMVPGAGAVAHRELFTALRRAATCDWMAAVCCVKSAIMVVARATRGLG